MSSILWLIPAFPLASFLILALTGGKLTQKAIATVSVGCAAASTIVTAIVGSRFAYAVPAGNAYTQTLWQWLHLGPFAPTFGLRLDALSLTMIAVITVVGLLILIYSTAFMRSDEGYNRFFAYMSLFLGSMLILVLADNLLFLYLGWEGVGLCSYLLIGHWYKEPENVRAALKAFFMTRIGDTSLLIGLFLLVITFGTLDIQTVLRDISRYPVGAGLCNAAAGLLLGGAVGKSAQLPLQTWLPDAMAGPTPVSALIHAATMVIAGVYLIARTNAIFLMAPAVMTAVTIIGLVTLLLAGFSALAQRDIKRILAYSTMSQVGYMFLALGVGSWAGGIYHFITQALFKSALFLGAGILIQSLDGEHDIFKMGGLHKRLPSTTRAFFAASMTLAAVPPLSISFNSKDVVLNDVWLSPRGGPVLWAWALFGAFLTAAYAFRLFFTVFAGPVRQEPRHKPWTRMLVSFTLLAYLAALAGYPDLLHAAFGIDSIPDLLALTLPHASYSFREEGWTWIFQAIYAGVSLVAIGLMYVLYHADLGFVRRLTAWRPGALVHQAWLAGWGFDWVYVVGLARGYAGLARLNSSDVVLTVYAGVGRFFGRCSDLLRWTVVGNVRWYVAAVAGGAAIVVGVAVILW
jgi:NADH-quinone oxidoreductase subunit L